MIIDYSRRTDPACRKGLEILKSNIEKKGEPKLLHFWTKAPAVLAIIYRDIINELKSNGVVICAQVTINNYGQPLEQVTPKMQELEDLVQLLGAENIRLRFDPIIFGFTAMRHYKKTLGIAEKFGISRITVNFLETKYQAVGEKLMRAGINAYDGNTEKKVEILNRLRQLTPRKIEIAVCAESSNLYNMTDGKCRVYPCAEEKGLKFCYECKDFLCDYLQPFADKADVVPHNTKVFNLCLIKKMGLERWAKGKAKEVKETYFTGKWKL